MVNQHRTAPELQIVMPIHNEGESIGATLHEWYNELSPRVRLEFVACEDGSTDNTKAVLTQLSHDLPIKLLMAEGRKGYSRAVIDGFAATLAPYVLAVDSDGQCDPKDFWQFWERRDQGDVAIGWRVQAVVQDAVPRAYPRSELPVPPYPAACAPARRAHTGVLVGVHGTDLSRQVQSGGVAGPAPPAEGRCNPCLSMAQGAWYCDGPQPRPSQNLARD